MPLKSARLDELPVCRSLARGRGSLAVSSFFFFFKWKGKEVGKKNGVCAEVEHGEEGSLSVCRELIPKGQIS